MVRTTRRVAAWIARGALLTAVAVVPAAALEEELEGGVGAVSTPGALPSPDGLEGLFELPSDRSYTIEKRGGRTRGEWRVAFSELNESLAEEQELPRRGRGRARRGGLVDERLAGRRAGAGPRHE